MSVCWSSTVLIGSGHVQCPPYPRDPESIYSVPHLVHFRGASRSVCEAGQGAAPAGLATQVKHSGGAGAPPGTTRSPCQELADERKRVRPTSRAKARPGADKTSAIGAPRGARASLGTRAIMDCVFRRAIPSSRDEGRRAKPGRRTRVAARRTHVCYSRAASTIPPLDGRVARSFERAGWGEAAPHPGVAKRRRTSPQGGGMEHETARHIQGQHLR